MYQVKIFRHEMVLYTAWEYGISNARRLLQTYEFKRGATTKAFRLKRDAVAFAERVKLTVAWQRGRLGLTNKVPDVFVC